MIDAFSKMTLRLMDIVFSDEWDNIRTLTTGFLTGMISGAVIWSTICNTATLFCYGVLGGIASMIGKGLYSYVKDKITNEENN